MVLFDDNYLCKSEWNGSPNPNMTNTAPHLSLSRFSLPSSKKFRQPIAVRDFFAVLMIKIGKSKIIVAQHVPFNSDGFS